MATTEGRTRGRRAAGVREIARLTGYSPSYVCIVRKGERKAPHLRIPTRLSFSTPRSRRYLALWHGRAASPQLQTILR